MNIIFNMFYFKLNLHSSSFSFYIFVIIFFMTLVSSVFSSKFNSKEKKTYTYNNYVQTLLSTVWTAICSFVFKDNISKQKPQPQETNKSIQENLSIELKCIYLYQS